MKGCCHPVVLGVPEGRGRGLQMEPYGSWDNPCSSNTLVILGGCLTSPSLFPYLWNGNSPSDIAGTGCDSVYKILSAFLIRDC